MGRLYDAYIEIGPRFAGFGDIKKQGDKAGAEYGKALAEAAAKAAAAKVGKLGVSLAKARDAEAVAAGKVRVAEAKLNEVRNDSKAKASQIAAAEEALATAQRKSATATNTATTAAESLEKARTKVSRTAEAAGKTSGGRFSNGFSSGTMKIGTGFRGALSRIGGEKEGKQVAGRFGIGFNGAFGGIAKHSAGLFVTAFATIKSVQMFGGFIKDAAESAKISRITANAIRTTGGAAHVSADQVGELATAISNKTAIDDEQVQTAANMLLTFKQIRNETGKGNDIFNQATQAAADLSVQFGGIDGASKQLGKALNDPIKGTAALSKAGVTFTDQQKKQIKTLVKSGDVLGAQKIILKEIQGQVGGAAQAAADPMERLKVIAGNLSEEIGGFLLPAAGRFADFVSDKLIPGISGLANLIFKGDFTKQMRETFNVEEDSGFVTFLLKARDTAISFFTEVKGGFSAFAAAWVANDGDITSSGFPGFMERLGYAAHQAFDFFRAEVLPRLKEFGSYVRDTIIPVIGDFITTRLSVLKDSFGQVKQAIADNRPQLEQLAGAIQKVAKFVIEQLIPFLSKLSLSTMPLLGKGISTVIATVGLMVDAFVFFKTMAQGVIAFVVDVFLGFVGTVIEGAAKAFGWVPGLGGKLKTAAADFATFRDDVNAKLLGIKDQQIVIHPTVAAAKAARAQTQDPRYGGHAILATGGPVFGPGSGTSDSIPAMLSNGEHVITAREVRGAGGHRAIEAARRDWGGYAKGGAVGFDVKTPLPTVNTKDIADVAVAVARPLAQKMGNALAQTLSPGGPPGSRHSFRGQTLNSRTIGMLLTAERFLGHVFRIMQGSYSTRVAASGSTHAGGGAMDTDGPGGWNSAVSALRRAGFAAWHRTPAQGPWGHHIHSIAIGDSSASSAAKSQVRDFLRGGDGLGGMRRGGRVLLRDNGGPLPPGMFAYNGTRRTETVRTHEQEASLRRPVSVTIPIHIGDEVVRVVRGEINASGEFSGTVSRMNR